MRTLRLARWAQHGLVRLIQALADSLSPPVCAFCRADTGPLAVGRLCRPCVAELTVQQGEMCRRCGADVPPSRLGQEGCPSCARQRFAFQKVVALGEYEGALREAVLRTKRGGAFPLSLGLAELLVQRRIAALRDPVPDVVVPVPMYWTRRIDRGHSTPEIVAEVLAAGLGIPTWRRGLVVCRNLRKQSQLSTADRRRNVRGAFRVRRGYRFQGRHVLLVDDVLTSGATCDELSRVLRQAGAAGVQVAVLARAANL